MIKMFCLQSGGSIGWRTLVVGALVLFAVSFIFLRQQSSPEVARATEDPVAVVRSCNREPSCLIDGFVKFGTVAHGRDLAMIINCGGRCPLGTVSATDLIKAADAVALNGFKHIDIDEVILPGTAKWAESVDSYSRQWLGPR